MSSLIGRGQTLTDIFVVFTLSQGQNLKEVCVIFTITRVRLSYMLMLSLLSQSQTLRGLDVVLTRPDSAAPLQQTLHMLKTP